MHDLHSCDVPSFHIERFRTPKLGGSITENIPTIHHSALPAASSFWLRPCQHRMAWVQNSVLFSVSSEFGAVSASSSPPRLDPHLIEAARVRLPWEEEVENDINGVACLSEEISSGQQWYQTRQILTRLWVLPRDMSNGSWESYAIAANNGEDKMLSSVPQLLRLPPDDIEKSAKTVLSILKLPPALLRREPLLLTVPPGLLVKGFEKLLCEDASLAGSDEVSRLTVLAACKDTSGLLLEAATIPTIHSNEVNTDRKAADYKLKQRKLVREMKQIRYDSQKSLELLGAAYPHLAIPRNQMHTSDEIECSYEQLIDILYQDNGIFSDTELLPVAIDGKSISMTIEVLCRTRNLYAAMMLLKRSVDAVIYNRKLREKYENHNSVFWHDEESDNNELTTVYKSILSMLGRVQSQSTSDWKRTSAVYSNLTLHLLREHITSVVKIQPGLQLYHAALNALGRHGSSEAIRTLLDKMIDTPPDRMAYQIVISSLSKSGQCLDAVQFLRQMREKGFWPDIGCYNELLIGIAKHAGRHQSGKNSEQNPISWHKLALEILHDIESQSDLAASISDQTYNSVISACGKEKQWDAAAEVATKASNSTIFTNNIGNGDERTSSYFFNLETFNRNGKGSEAWWEIAKYSCGQRAITVGIQPHRNHKLNGMSLVFYRDDLRGNRMKVGRVLLKNDVERGFYFSSIIGMEVNADLRGEGLSKVLIAIWLDICLQTDSFPRAAMMNKPLIALVLSKFGFVPDGGTNCVLVRLENDDNDSTFGLYSPHKSLDGALSHRVLRTQNIKLLRTLPDSSRQKGVDVVIKTTFHHPFKPPPDGNEDSNKMQVEKNRLKGKINAALGSAAAMEYFSSQDKLSNAFLFL